MKRLSLYFQFAIAGSLLIGGCAVGPDYHRPTTATPEKWSEPMAAGETNAPATDVAEWWNHFHDAEMNSLIERAARSNLDLKIAAARVLEARAQYKVAAADFWPSLDTSALYNRGRQSQNQPIIGSFPVPKEAFKYNLYQAGFDASWEIDVFGGTRRATEAAKARVAAAEFSRRDTLVSLLAEVARNYVEARGFQQRLAIARQNIEAQEQTLAITQNRFTNGLAPNLDVQQAATLLSTTRAEVPSLEAAFETAVHHLAILLGETPGALIGELSRTAPIPAAPPVVPVGLPSDLLLRRPDIQLAERELAATTAEIGVATADLFPKFSLTGVAGLQSVSASDWFTAGSRFWSVGPTVQWAIFDAGRIRANIQVKNARQEQALASYEKTVLTSFEDVENALVKYAKEQTRRASLQDAVKSSQESLRAANQLYSNGLANFINVLDAQRSLYQAQDQLVRSDEAVSLNLISLYKALGGGWETAGEKQESGG